MMSPASGVLPLDEHQADRLHSAVADLTAMQLQWVSGYAAGLAAAGGASSATASSEGAAAPHDKRLTVLFGSQTGNGEGIAEALTRKAREQGFAARSTSLADFKPADLKRETLVTVVISTHGDGDPPDDAELFYEYLMSKKAAALTGLRFSVLALGDSSYVNFCQTGREVDARLVELGAERFAPLVECDLDYDDMASAWSESVLGELSQLLDAGQQVPHLRAVESTSTYDRQNPFLAEVLVNQKITGANSSKDVRHIELSLEGSGLHYEPGDSLAVLSENPPQLVDQVLTELELDATISVETQDGELTLGDALSNRLEITATNVAFLRSWASLSRSAELTRLLDDPDRGVLARFLEQHQIIDVVRLFPADVDAQSFVDMLRTLSPRSYSISSSPRANPGEAHLTVAAVRYDAFGREHWGAASTHLADRICEGDRVAVYVEPNWRFRLPEPDRPMIMIGPGTGVAPFRAFIEERIEQGARGDSWLIFGDRNSDSDFLYQLEWQRHIKQGHLARLDVAFSRDREHKEYVQHRIAENAAELYRWLENGAAIYVCGDAKRMAHDVHQALIGVLVTQGGLDAESAEQRLRDLRSAGRYQRDVY